MMLALLSLAAGAALGLEAAAYTSTVLCRKKFPWLITAGCDANPHIDKAALLNKYIDKGFDPELGWTRRPNTSGYDEVFCRLENGSWGYKKSAWTMNHRSARINPNCESLDDTILSCYGDSFTFSRQVTDNETWPHVLSKTAGINALNFGVGNYGLDQAILRLEREFTKNKTNVVVMSVVPDTVSRIASCWKHFYEYGNVWAFKPRFELGKSGNLAFVPNIINSPEKFFELDKYMDKLRTHDYFYDKKFETDLMRFPYMASIVRNPARNIGILYGVTKHILGAHFSRQYKERYGCAKAQDWPVMDIIRRINLDWTARLYEDKGIIALLGALVDRFAEDGKKLGFRPVFAFLPQKNEITEYKRTRGFYMPFFKSISTKIDTIDVTTPLASHPGLDSLYSEQSAYGAHYNAVGNAFVANVIYDGLKAKGLLN